MIQRISLLALVFALAACASPPLDLPAPADDPMLQSAGLERARGRVAGIQRDPAEEKAHLVAHFDRVLQILERAAPPSPELADRRALQIERLRRYRDEGRFPLNREGTGRTLPIFVDAEDTACAVGWLMRQDGWDEAVETIRSSDNHVYVDDVAGGPLLAWVATSGLTREEAALIQPSYIPPDFSNTTFEDLLAGGSLSKNGLLFDNFSLERATPLVGAEVCILAPDHAQCQAPIDPASVAPTTDIGIASGVDEIPSPGAGETATLSNWLYIGGAPNLLEAVAGVSNDGLGAGGSSYSIIDIVFDVSAIDPTEGIGAAMLWSSRYINLNVAEEVFPNVQIFLATGLIWETSLVLTTSLESDGESLGELSIGESAADLTPAYGFYPPVDLVVAGEMTSFAPVSSLRVRTRAFVFEDALLSGFFHEFDLVPIPEPTSGLLLALGLGGLVLRRRYGASPT